MNIKDDFFMIDVRGLIKEIIEKLGVIILAGILFAGVFFLYASQRIQPTYQAGFTAYINNASSKSVIQSLNSGDTLAAESLTYTYVSIMRSRPLVIRALEDAGLEYSYEAVAGRISSDTQEQTQLITVTVTMESPEDAYKLALSLSQDAPAYMEDIVNGSSMKIVEEPVFPIASNYPNVKRITLLGGIFGFLLMFLLVVVLFIVDDRVKNPDILERKFDCAVIGLTPDIFASGLYRKRYGRELTEEEKAAAKALEGTEAKAAEGEKKDSRYKKRSQYKAASKSGNDSVISRAAAWIDEAFDAIRLDDKKPVKKNGQTKKLNVHKKTDKELLILSDSSPWIVQESFKKMRSNLMFSLPGAEGKLIGVTSARSHDGKTVNTVNLAIAFAQIGRKVLLIEGDLRKPAVAELTGAPQTPGLTEIVTGNCTREEAIHHIEKHGLDVLPSGTLPPDPTWILQSAQLRDLLSTLKESYDYIFFDLPPVITVTDAVVVSESVDGYLMVVRHGRTKLGDVDKMMAQLRIADARIIGFVENQAVSDDEKDLRNYYYKSFRSPDKNAG